MDDNLKIRYEELKRKNSEFVRKNNWKRNIMLQDCLALLGDKAEILPVDIQDEIIRDVNDILEKNYNNFAKCGDIDSIEAVLKDWYGETAYIVWNEIKLPVVKCTISEIANNISSIVEIDFETMIVSEGCCVCVRIDDYNMVFVYRK